MTSHPQATPPLIFVLLWDVFLGGACHRFTYPPREAFKDRKNFGNVIWVGFIDDILKILMKYTGLITVRTSSTRLPNKCLLPFELYVNVFPVADSIVFKRFVSLSIASSSFVFYSTSRLVLQSV